MRKVYKYDVPECEGEFIRSMPSGAKILAVQMQGNHPKMWALVETEYTKMVNYNFFVCTTGTPIKHNNILTYVGTFQLRQGELVFHVFQIGAHSSWEDV